MKVTKDYQDFEIIDTSNGYKLERWGKYTLLRPDPQVMWDNGDLESKYHDINAVYYRSNTGGGHWEDKRKLPDSWIIRYRDMQLI